MHSSLKILEQEMRELLPGPFAGAEFPPKCFLSMNAEFVEYESRTSLTVRVPVLDASLNPLQMMQGGFITAALDNTFGPLSYLAAGKPCVTLDITTQFIRPVKAGDELTVRATVISRGRNALYMKAQAFNRKGKLVATAGSNALILLGHSAGA
jgi:uncharacterized protein (TIGR00369 family)